MAKILVVDDEPALVRTSGYTLRRDGHAVLTAADGGRALDLARRERPGLVVLDLWLPRLDGLDVCRARRRSPAHALRAVPILKLSARADAVDTVVGRQRHVNRAEIGDRLAEACSSREVGHYAAASPVTSRQVANRVCSSWW